MASAKGGVRRSVEPNITLFSPAEIRVVSDRGAWTARAFEPSAAHLCQQRAPPPPAGHDPCRRGAGCGVPAVCLPDHPAQAGWLHSFGRGDEQCPGHDGVQTLTWARYLRYSAAECQGSGSPCIRDRACIAHSPPHTHVPPGEAVSRADLSSRSPQDALQAHPLEEREHELQVPRGARRVRAVVYCRAGWLFVVLFSGHHMQVGHGQGLLHAGLCPLHPSMLLPGLCLTWQPPQCFSLQSPATP